MVFRSAILAQAQAGARPWSPPRRGRRPSVRSFREAIGRIWLGAALGRVQAPTLLIVGGEDYQMIQLVKCPAHFVPAVGAMRRVGSV